MELIPHEGLVMAKRQTTPKTMQFEMECDFMQYENKVKTTKGINSPNLLGENIPKGVQKPSQKDHLSINVACIRMLA
jgi:hypothetical protein